MSPLTRRQFENVQSSIAAAHSAYLLTPYAQRRNEHRLAQGSLTYDEFLLYAPTTPTALPSGDLSDLLLRTSQLEEFRTTGTSGTPRSIYWPRGTAADVKSLLSKVALGTRTTAIFASAVVESDIFLRAHIQGLREAVPGIAISSFATADDVASIIRRSDSLILFDYPSALPRLLRLTEDAMLGGKISAAELRNQTLAVRLTGEPMRNDELRIWCGKAKALGYDAKIELRYGCTEFLGVGRSELDFDAAVVEYGLTNQRCFAEVLDPQDLHPIYDGRGLLCATSFRTSGTILFRYLLGDEVSIGERNGERIVWDIRRPDVLIVTGNTASLSEIVGGARKATGLEICLDVKKAVDRLTGVQRIDVWVYVPSERSTDLEAARADVQSRLLEELKIRPKVEGGFVVLEVRALSLGTSPERRRKAWKVL